MAFGIALIIFAFIVYIFQKDVDGLPRGIFLEHPFLKTVFLLLSGCFFWIGVYLIVTG